MFSPDPFEGCDEDDEVVDTRGVDLEEIENVVSQKYRSLMTGVLPAPELRLPIGEFLHRYEENLRKMDEMQGNETLNSSTGSIYRATKDGDEVITAEWPGSFYMNGFGLHYYRSTTSEEVERMSLQMVDRFITSETSSSYNTLQLPAVNTVKEQKPSLPSPRRRLSHLARRRDVFSSVNLKNTSFVKVYRQISISKGRQGKRKPATKIPTPKRKTPPAKAAQADSSSAVIVKRPLSRENSKRALFQSPARSQPLPEAKKRRIDDEGSVDRESRSLDVTSTTNTTEMQVHHRQKLLWAVSVALKNKNIQNSHPMYKKYAADLSKTVKLCYQLFSYAGSTSAKMKRIANSYFHDVIKGVPMEDILRKEREYVAKQNALNPVVGQVTSTAVPKRITTSTTDHNNTTSHTTNTSSRPAFRPFCENAVDTFQYFQSHPTVVRAQKPLDVDTAFGIGKMGLPMVGAKKGPTDTVLRENIDTQLRQKSANKVDTEDFHPFGKLNKYSGGGGQSDASKVRRQITFDL